jgi:hypothetical protein
LVVTALNRPGSALSPASTTSHFGVLVVAHTAVLLRVGYDLTADVPKHVARNVVYGAVRLAFDPAEFVLQGAERRVGDRPVHR